MTNTFRKRTLGLEPLSSRSGPSVLDRLKVPWTYCWSRSLIPKPLDWKNTIDVSGFYFLETDSVRSRRPFTFDVCYERDADSRKRLHFDQNYSPPPEMQAFLDAGEPPIYIGCVLLPLVSSPVLPVERLTVRLAS